MSSSKDYRDYILEQLRDLDGITCKPMMGEYLLYYQGTLFGGIYDNELLVKITEYSGTFNLEQVVPYKGARPMYLVDAVDNKEALNEIVLKTYEGLIGGKNKK